MYNTINISSYLNQHTADNPQYVMFPFYRNNQPLLLSSPVWGMTLKSAGTMRFRWNEENPERIRMLTKVCGRDDFVSLELIHSKTVYTINSKRETLMQAGDGMITDNIRLVPVVTVADCVPMYLFDPVKGCFGSFHSGWKGTGIIQNGIEQMKRDFGSKSEDICAAIGPHIHKCCYNVNKERADYFVSNFTPDCVKKIDGKEEYSLSLLEANLSVLKSCGVKEENIVYAEDCTCCSRLSNGDYPFGSFRRQAAILPPDTDPDVRSRSMTVQAAFCGYLISPYSL